MPYKFLLFDLDHTLLDFDVAEDVALTQLLNEEGVADIQAYKDYYIPMNKALWKDLEQKKISKQELVNTRFSRLFAHFGLEKRRVVFLPSVYQFYLAQQGQNFFQVLMNSWTVSSNEIMACMLRQMGLLPSRQDVWLNLVWLPISTKFLSPNSYKHKNLMHYSMKKYGSADCWI
mgnify:CR=1 FL=1